MSNVPIADMGNPVKGIHIGMAFINVIMITGIIFHTIDVICGAQKGKETEMRLYYDENGGEFVLTMIKRGGYDED